MPPSHALKEERIKATKHARLSRELARLEAEYARRDGDNIYRERYSCFSGATLQHKQSLERALLILLKRHNFSDLSEKKILDVGCGVGSHLRRFLEYGALPAHLAGIDLIVPRIEHARRLHPAIDYRVGSAHELPYADATFDLVMSFVVFSSILDKALQRRIADEMWRVRRPGGLILVYDFVYSNPRNAAVIGFGPRKVKQVFARSEASFDTRRLTLAPPLSRLLMPLSYWLATTLEGCEFLNTHALTIITRTTNHPERL